MKSLKGRPCYRISNTNRLKFKTFFSLELFLNWYYILDMMINYLHMAEIDGLYDVSIT